MTAFTESVVGDAVLAWLEALGSSVLDGPDIAANQRKDGSVAGAQWVSGSVRARGAG